VTERRQAVPVRRNRLSMSDLRRKFAPNCDKCGKKFTETETIFSYGSCRIDLCRRCFMSKLED